jgi:hypothetical protein
LLKTLLAEPDTRLHPTSARTWDDDEPRLPPRKHGVMIPGPQNHAATIAFEKYFLWKMKNGYERLP